MLHMLVIHKTDMLNTCFTYAAYVKHTCYVDTYMLEILAKDIKVNTSDLYMLYS